MGSIHIDGSQGKLHGLFNGFSDLVASRLAASIRRVMKSRIDDDPVRILDIGCGHVPYRDAFKDFADEQLELIFLDQSRDLPGDCAEGLPAHKWLRKNFFDFWPSFPASSHGVDPLIKETIGRKVDIVVCAASLHELHFDSVALFGQPIDFHHVCFEFIKKHFLLPKGLLLVADYAWPSPARTLDLWKIKKVQLHVVKHADPPWAFRSVSSIQDSARLAGLKLIESSGQGLHDDLSDTELSTRYGNLLEPNELRTLRSRFGFVAVFDIGDEPPMYSASGEQAPKPRLASREISLRAEEIFDDRTVNIESGLQELFTRPIDNESGLLGGKAPLCHFVDGMSQRIRMLQPTFEISNGVLEVWANIGLKKRDGSSTRRFIPKLPVQWDTKMPDRAAGALSTDLLRASADKVGRPFAGRVAIPFGTHLQENRSLHHWFSDLHALLRGQPAQATSGVDIKLVRSLTILAQDLTAPNSEPTCTSLSYASSWGTKEEQAESGHYLVILPWPDDSMEDTAFVGCINKCLDRIARNVLGFGNTPQTLSAEYEQFLRSVFYPSNSRCTTSHDECEFGKWWKENRECTDTNAEGPRYRAFTTIVLGCDGLAKEAPDSLMVFSTEAISPKTLEVAGEDFATACRRLATLESEVLVKNKSAAEAELAERDRQHRAMVTSFGHDGKRPASTIELLLRSESPMAVKLARMLSRSLVLRMEAFSSLLSAPETKDEAKRRLADEYRNAESMTTLQAIWEEEALSILLRILVDGSGFQKIRESVFGKNVTVESYRELFDPLTVFLANHHESDINGFAYAVHETLQKFAILSPAFDVGYIGPRIQLPYDLRGRDGSNRVPLAVPSLSFVISEMLTNNAKYQWAAWDYKRKSEGIQLRLIAQAQECGADLTLLSKPMLSADPSSALTGEKRTITGLMSLGLVTRGLGLSPSCQTVSINGRILGDFPFPSNRVWTIEDISESWCTYSLGRLHVPTQNLESQQ